MLRLLLYSKGVNPLCIERQDNVANLCFFSLLHQGEEGPMGEDGPQGTQGSSGPRGAPGLQGPQGSKGIQGDQGAKGM